MQKLFAFIKKHHKVLRYIFGLVAISFMVMVAFEVVNEWGTVEWDKYEFNVWPLGIYFLLVFLSFGFYIASWKFSLKVLNENIGWIPSATIYLKSQVGKYIPGKVGLVITKVMEAQRKGIKVRQATIASSLEIALQLYTMLLIGVMALYFVGN